MATTAKVTAQSYNTRYLMFKSKIQENLSNLSNEDKQLVARWVDKLNSFCTKMSELEMRNNIIMNLLFQTQTGKLSKPFSSPPTFSSLDKVPIQDLSKEEIFPEDLRLPLIMQNSPDHGAFLVSQPVPKCGAFAYIAIVSRPMNK